ADGSGFTYNLMNSEDVHDKNREVNTKSYFHVVGTDPKSDIVVLSGEKYASLGIKPQDIPIVAFSDDHQWLVAIAASVQNELTVVVAPASELKSTSIPWKQFLQPGDEVTNVVAHGDMVYLLSHKDAPKYKILATSLSHPDVAHAELVLPEGQETIDSMDRTKDYLLVTTTDGINNHVQQYSYADKKWDAVKLPRTGTVAMNGYDILSNDDQIAVP